jgi:hypothetical protein
MMSGRRKKIKREKKEKKPLEKDGRMSLTRLCIGHALQIFPHHSM